MNTGRFISLEGGEGAGKSTQAQILADRLLAHGIDVLVTREPGGTRLGEDVRALILAAKPATPVTELLLFAAARAEHLAAVIVPALDAGRWVVCDRFTDSTRVYQGDAAGNDPRLIAALETLTVAPHLPDLTLVLDLSPETGVARAKQRGGLNRYDVEAAAHHETLRRGFLRIAAAEPGRCVVIDAALAPEQVAERIWAAVEGRLMAKVP